MFSVSFSRSAKPKTKKLLLEMFGRSVHQSVEHLYVSKLQRLDMSRNRLGRLSCKALSRVLSHDGFPLRALNLSWNSIAPADVKVLCEALAVGVGPIDDNDIEVAEAAALAAAAAGAKTAEEVAEAEARVRKAACVAWRGVAWRGVAWRGVVYFRIMMPLPPGPRRSRSRGCEDAAVAVVVKMSTCCSCWWWWWWWW